MKERFSAAAAISPLSLVGWGASALLFLVSFYLLFAHFFVSDDAAIERALLDGQRVEISLDDLIKGPVREEDHLPQSTIDANIKRALEAQAKAEDEAKELSSSGKNQMKKKSSDQASSKASKRQEEEGGSQTETKKEAEKVALSAADLEKSGSQIENSEFDPDKPISLPALASANIEGPKPAPSKFVYPQPNPKLLSKDLPKFQRPSGKAIYSDQLRKSPVIVVVVSNLGLSATTTEKALELPNSITLGFSPYSSSLKTWEDEAKAKGFEYLLNIPMETMDFRVEDPGPYALTTKGEKEENITRLNMLLRLMEKYKGVYTDHDEVVTQNEEVIKPIIKLLKTSNIPFLYGEGYANYSFVQLSNRMRYPILTRDVLLDSVLTVEGINEQFLRAESLAQENGYAVVLARPYPLTLQLLNQWVRHLEKDKIATVVPASYLLGRQIVPPASEMLNRSVKTSPAPASKKIQAKDSSAESSATKEKTSEAIGKPKAKEDSVLEAKKDKKKPAEEVGKSEIEKPNASGSKASLSSDAQTSTPTKTKLKKENKLPSHPAADLPAQQKKIPTKILDSNSSGEVSKLPPLLKKKEGGSQVIPEGAEKRTLKGSQVNTAKEAGASSLLLSPSQAGGALSLEGSSSNP